jgi:hypothetical protein
MNIHNIVYNGIRLLSLISIFTLLSLSLILPISFVQALLVNPIILVALMAVFALLNEKLKSKKKLADIVRLPNNPKC